jgi:hypothetical protein
MLSTELGEISGQARMCYDPHKAVQLSALNAGGPVTARVGSPKFAAALVLILSV